MKGQEARTGKGRGDRRGKYRNKKILKQNKIIKLIAYGEHKRINIRCFGM